MRRPSCTLTLTKIMIMIMTIRRNGEQSEEDMGREVGSKLRRRRRRRKEEKISWE